MRPGALVERGRVCVRPACEGLGQDCAAGDTPAHLRLFGACTDQPKSAILSSPLVPSSRFSGLMSRWMTCLEWQYSSARPNEAMYLQGHDAQR